MGTCYSSSITRPQAVDCQIDDSQAQVDPRQTLELNQDVRRQLAFGFQSTCVVLKPDSRQGAHVELDGEIRVWVTIPVAVGNVGLRCIEGTAVTGSCTVRCQQTEKERQEEEKLLLEYQSEWGMESTDDPNDSDDDGVIWAPSYVTLRSQAECSRKRAAARGRQSGTARALRLSEMKRAELGARQRREMETTPITGTCLGADGCLSIQLTINGSVVTLVSGLGQCRDEHNGEEHDDVPMIKLLQEHDQYDDPHERLLWRQDIGGKLSFIAPPGEGWRVVLPRRCSHDRGRVERGPRLSLYTAVSAFEPDAESVVNQQVHTFLLGTHSRLGAASPVLWLAGMPEVLALISHALKAVQVADWEGLEQHVKRALGNRKAMDDLHVLPRDLPHALPWEAAFATRAVEQYRHFLALKVQQADWDSTMLSPGSSALDFVWHIHLSWPQLYQTACYAMGAERVIQHLPVAETRERYALAFDLHCARMEELGEVVDAHFWPDPSGAGVTREVSSFNGCC